MECYRILTETALNRLRTRRQLEPTTVSWHRYSPGSVVLLFLEDDPANAMREHGIAIAEGHDAPEGSYLYVIHISNVDEGKIEPDSSQSGGWDSSIAHFGAIDAANITIVGRSRIVSRRPGRYSIGDFEAMDERP